MQHLGIFGGTFNPPHWGHLSVAIAALSQFHLDGVVWVPSFAPRHRQGDPVVDFAHRLEMVKRAIAICPRFSVIVGESAADASSFAHPSFAVDTLNLLEATYPNRKWFWVIGLDAFQTLPRWYQRATLIPRCDWLVAPRLTVQNQTCENQTTGRSDLKSSLEEKILSDFAVALHSSNPSISTERQPLNAVRLNTVLYKLATQFDGLMAEAIAQTTQQCQIIENLLHQQNINLHWQVLALPPIPISSQKIRQSLAPLTPRSTHPPTSTEVRHLDLLPSLTPSAVADYITQWHLYSPTTNETQPS